MEVTEEELRHMAAEICKTEEQADLLEHEIDHIMYLQPTPNEPTGKKVGLAVALGVSYSVLMLVLIVCGVIQIGSWIVDWMY